jgi:ribosomal protein L30
LSEIQAREVLVDFAFMNLSLKNRPKFYTEFDLQNEALYEKAILPDKFELDDLDFRLRGKLLRHALGSAVGQMTFIDKTPQQIEQFIDNGRLSFLFDDTGDFIKNGFRPISRYIEIQQTRSASRRPRYQRQTLIGLGLNRIGRIRLVLDTPANRGMIRKVAHLVQINNDPAAPD